MNVGFGGPGFGALFGSWLRPMQNIGVSDTQRAQYPLIKEYSLNHNMKPYII